LLEKTAEPLTALDRCDRCSARALARVTLLSGGGLLLCAHHGREYQPALELQGATVTFEEEEE
jgi:hypothetical protein